MKGLILEGINGAGKTIVLNRLRSRLSSLRQEAHLLLTEQYTQRLIDRNLNESDQYQFILDLLDSYLTFLEGIRERFGRSIFAHHPRRDAIEFAYIFERFHFGQLILRGFKCEAPFQQFDQRLAALGAKMVLLTIPQERIFERCVESTRGFRTVGWREYQEAFGLDDSGLVSKYSEDQNRLLEMSQASAIPLQVIDTKDKDWETIELRVYDFWQQTGS